ncbi:hypothetical protein HKD37_12G034291 [Glycine soja]
MLAQNKLLAKTLETLTTTLSNLPQQLHVMQHSPSLVMHIKRCNICGGTHESDSCMFQDDASNEVNYTGSHNHQGGPPGFYQRDNFLTESHKKSTDATIRNLEVQLAKLVAERPTETFGVNIEIKPKEKCKVIFIGREEKEKKIEEDVRDEIGEKKEERGRNEEKAQQWKKCSQEGIQQKSILQVNTPSHQLIVKEERHREHDKPLSVILSLTTSTSLTKI